MGLAQQLDALLDHGNACIFLLRPWFDPPQSTVDDVGMRRHLRPPIGTTTSPVRATGGEVQYLAQSVMSCTRLAIMSLRR